MTRRFFHLDLSSRRPPDVVPAEPPLHELVADKRAIAIAKQASQRKTCKTCKGQGWVRVELLYSAVNEPCPDCQ